MNRVGAFAFAAMPILVGLLALGQLRSAAVHQAPARALRVAAADVRIAWKFPGEAAVSLGPLPPPSFERLPFDLVTTETGEVRYQRARTWSLLDEWNGWDASLDGVPCRDRTPAGGWSCGGVCSVTPDLIEVGPELWAVAVVSQIPTGHRFTLRAGRAPVRLTASLVTLADGRLPYIVSFEREGRVIESRCGDSKVCGATAPEGSGPLLVRIDGPSPALGVDLRAQP